MPIKTVAAFLREDRNKLRKAALERMRRRWIAMPKTETKSKRRKKNTATAGKLAIQL